VKFWIHRGFVIVLSLLGAATVVVWVRSHFVGDSYRWTSLLDASERVRLRRASLYTGAGGVGGFIDSIESSDPDRLERMRWRLRERSQMFSPGYSGSANPSYPPRIGGTDFFLAPLGVHVFREARVGRGGEYHLIAFILPLWLILLLTAGYPVARYVLSVLARQQQERLAVGMCPRCECDVRGKEKCPSCGRAIAPVLPALPA